MIYLIITTSINNYEGILDYYHRKNTYLNSITKTLSLLPSDIKPIIVENNGLRQTYLDELTVKVDYTDNNSVKYYHKGVNELLDIKYIINKYDIKDDDLIIKLTGRYYTLNDDFFQKIINNYNFDAYIKFYNVCALKFMDNDCVLGMYAIRCKYLKQFSYIDFNKSPEVEFAEFIRSNINSENIYSITDLKLRCCFANDFTMMDV